MKPWLGSGLAGAIGVTVLNEVARRGWRPAPRLDVLGSRALAKVLRRSGTEPPAGPRLKAAALAGDLVSNTLYYGLVALGSRRTAWWRGGALGLAAGLGAVALPPRLGLGRDVTAASPRRRAATVAWYLAGGLLAAFTSRRLARTP